MQATVKGMAALKRDVRDGVMEVIHPGRPRLSGEDLERLGRVSVTFVIVVTNLLGAVSVFLLCLIVVPLPDIRHAARVRTVNTELAAGYVVAAVVVGVLIGIRGLRRMRDWLQTERTPSLADARTVLLAPLRLFLLQFTLWCLAAALFGAVNFGYSSALGIEVGIVVLITGLVTASCAYLLTELILRPAAARALARGAPGRLAVPGVATRSVLAWAMGTGLPLVGVVGIGIRALVNPSSATGRGLAVAMTVLGGAGLAVGLLAVTAAARATADPVNSVRRALATVRQGEFDVRVPVYDGSEIGQLQLGFNDMVQGLAERERIREVFGTYVDPEVARHVLDEGQSLDGEEVEVTVMFVDIRDFTGFAEHKAASEVIAAINRLFEQVLPIIHDHAGRVDKFVGDGLLAVFGAPRRQPDHADQALSAALAIMQAVRRSDTELCIGIGINSGTVVAGNVGGAGRFEFSVIGDAVNVASRIEEATRETGDDILLAEATVELLQDGSVRMAKRADVPLRGRQEPVQLYAPDGDGSSQSGM